MCLKQFTSQESWIDIPQLYEQLSIQEQDCIQFLDDISILIESSIQLFQNLKDGIKLKYLLNKEILGRINMQQLNIAVCEMIQYQESKEYTQNTINNCVKTFQKDLTKLIIKFRIQELNYCINNRDQKVNILNADKVVNKEPNHLIILTCKTQSLFILDRFQEAIVQTDLILDINPKISTLLIAKFNAYCSLQIIKKLLLQQIEYCL